jgi:hypothetical protein
VDKAYDNLYSPVLQERYEATIHSHYVKEREWPEACYGAANAFLIICGPSPGKEDKGKVKKRGGDGRKKTNSKTIGKNVFDINWKGKARVARWNRLCNALIGEEDCIRSLTALLNLDWGNNSNSSNIPKTYLELGFSKYVWPLIIEAKPKILVALTNRVWDVMRNEILKHRVNYTVPSNKLTREPIFFRIPGSDFISVLIKTQNHPSRHFFTDKHIKEISGFTDWFLSQRD